MYKSAQRRSPIPQSHPIVVIFSDYFISQYLHLIFSFHFEKTSLMFALDYLILQTPSSTETFHHPTILILCSEIKCRVTIQSQLLLKELTWDKAGHT